MSKKQPAIIPKSYMHELPPMPKRNFFADLKERSQQQPEAENQHLYAKQKPSSGHGGRGGGPTDFRKPKNTKGTVLRILKYTTSNKLLLGCVLLMVLVSSLASVVASYFIRPIVDDYIVPGDFSGLLRQLIILGCIYLVGALTSYFQSRLTVSLGQWAVNRIREDLFSRVQDLPMSYFDTTSHGELMSRFTNDAESVQTMIEMGIIQLISGAISFVGALVAMLILSWQLFLITILTVGLSFFLVSRVSGKSKVMFQKQQASLGALNGYIEELTDGLKVVKAFSYEKRAVKTFDAVNDDYRENAILANFLGQLPMPILFALMNIGYAITTVVGGLLAIKNIGSVSIGTLGAYLSYTRQISMPINQISNQIVNLMSAIAGAERIFEVMDTLPEIDTGTVTLVTVEKAPDGRLVETEDGRRTGNWAWKIPGEHGATYQEVKGDVRLENVDFGYVPDKLVLKNISLYAKPGQKIAFVGSTGAGKTTITNLINRFYEIQSGTITYDGIDIRQIKKAALRRSLGIVLQDIQLFTGTVMDNIRYGKLDATDDECIEAAKVANAHSFIMRLPDGYETHITGNGSNLSQGQRQLLAIARTAVAKHPVMIMDEATSSIDTRTEKLIEQGMDALMENKTVFVIAHRLSTVRNARAIAVLEHGEIIEKGNHEDLLAHKGRYYMLYTGQTRME